MTRIIPTASSEETMTRTGTAPAAAITVAVIGTVSTGKSTIINAVFGDKYAETSLKRTTSGVYHFRLKKSAEKTPAEPIHSEVKANNAVNRESDEGDASISDTVKEKFFDIALTGDLCEMLEGVGLEIVDVAGINEAGSSRSYKDYLVLKWTTFDCAIVVVDATKEVNTDEQIELLELVKTNLETKNMPVIFLCNKVDNPSDYQILDMVTQYRKKIEKRFKVSDREEALQWVLEGCKGVAPSDVFPLFIPVSALNAFIFTKASSLEFDEFKKFDGQLIEMLGTKVFGWEWASYNDDEKYEKAYETVTDKNKREVGLKASNWDKFLKVFEFCVGGSETQTSLIEKQIEVATNLVSAESMIAPQLLVIYERGQFLGKATDHLQTVFWKNYEKCETDAFGAFILPVDVHRLSLPMKQLISYYHLVCQTMWKGEGTKAIERMKNLFLKQCGFIFEQERQWWLNNNGATQWWTLDTAPKEGDATAPPVPWEKLSPRDWTSVFGSVLVLSGERHFYESFGTARRALEQLANKHQQRLLNDLAWPPMCPNCPSATLNQYNQCGTCSSIFKLPGALASICPYCIYTYANIRRLDQNGKCTSNCGRIHKDHPGNLALSTSLKYENGGLVPENADRYKALSSIEVPESPSDPEHFGHVAWLFCRFMESKKSN